MGGFAPIIVPDVIPHLLSGTTHMASFQIFTDQTAWTSALGGSAIVTEDFNNGATLHSALQVFGGQYGMGDFEGYGTPGIYELMSQVSVNPFEFIPFISAKGGKWDLSSSGAGVGLELLARFHSGHFQTIGYIENPVDRLEHKRSL